VKTIELFGIDVSKASFDLVRLDPASGKASKPERFANSSAGFDALLARHGARAADSLAVLEATGGFERALAARLSEAGFAVHRAQPLKAKNFARSRSLAKTDRLDALALAHYGAANRGSLRIYRPPTAEQQELAALIRRRADLVGMQGEEKNRLTSPACQPNRDSILRHLA